MDDELKSCTGHRRQRGASGGAIAVALAKEQAGGWWFNYRSNAGGRAKAAWRRRGRRRAGRAIARAGRHRGREDRASGWCRQSLEAFGRIDLLVNNAGMAPRQRVDLLELSEASYDEVLATNLKGPFFLTQLVARQMIALARRGRPPRDRQHRLDQRLHQQHQPRRILPVQGRPGHDDRALCRPPGVVRHQRL